MGLDDSYAKKKDPEVKPLLDDRDETNDDENHHLSGENGYRDEAATAIQSEARIRRYMKGINAATRANGTKSEDVEAASDPANADLKPSMEKMHDDLGNFIDELENDNIVMYVGEEDDTTTAFATQEEVANYDVEGEFSGEVR